MVNIVKIEILKNKAQQPMMRPHEYWGIFSYLITAIATFGVDMLESCFDIIHDFLSLFDHFCI